MSRHSFKFFFSLLIAIQTHSFAETNWSELEATIQKISPDAVASCVSINSQSGSWGSGVIVSESGLVFTAAHLFNTSDELVTVILPNGTAKEAKVTHFNRSKDIAVVQINRYSGKHYTQVDLDNSSLDAEPFLAVGHASGYERARKSPPVRLGFGTVDPDKNVISTTCRITAGDSGGPLFDLSGKVVAIHRTMDSKGGLSQHISITSFFDKWPNLSVALKKETKTS